MIPRVIVLLLMTPACLAQTNGSAPSGQSDDIVAITAQANQGNTDAQLKLGDAYLRGRGVKQNDAEAFRWFLIAAEKGNAEAQYHVGSHYPIGRGVNRDDAEASKWFLKAAENGNAIAQYNMGVLYAYGRGVPKDNHLAAIWFRKSAEQGLAIGQMGLAAGYANGLGLPRDKAEALKGYRKHRPRSETCTTGAKELRRISSKQSCGLKGPQGKRTPTQSLISVSCTSTGRGCRPISLRPLNTMASLWSTAHLLR
jgi:hypothetical protein